MKQFGVIKTVLFTLTALLLFAPMTQERFKFFVFKPLEGVFEPAPEPNLTFDSYRTAKYQTQLEPYLSEHFGFREPLIRTYNQFLYDCFRKSYSQDVMVGKNHWLYFRQNVNDYYGTEMKRWFADADEAREAFDQEARLMWKLHGVLKDYGIDFLVFMAPEKGFLYPEHLPDRHFDTTSINARTYFSKKFDEYGFPYIEMTPWFIALKEADTLPYSLFPQTGAHWCFSSVLAADSLFRFMGHLSGKPLPKLSIGPLHERVERERNADFDLEGIVNLWRPLPHEDNRLLEAEVSVVNDSTATKPNVLFVGTSFLWQMVMYIPFDELFSYSEYWYYNSTAYFGKDYHQIANVGDLDVLQKLLDADYIVWLSEGEQMYKASFKFVESALVKLCVSEDRQAAVKQHLMDSLRNDRQVMASLDPNLEENKLTGLLWEKANRMILREPEKYFPELAGDSIPTARNPRVPEALAIKEIKKDSAWMMNLQCQTVIHNTTLEQVLKREAQNILNDRPLMRDMENVVSRTTYVESLVKAMEETILGNEELTRMAREKSEQNGISFEEQVNADARWIINYQINNGEIVF